MSFEKKCEWVTARLRYLTSLEIDNTFSLTKLIHELDILKTKIEDIIQQEK